MTRWQQELEKVRLAHKGRLHPKHVVEAARSKTSPLHSKFEWDDRKASEAYRLQQAQELIREVTFLPKGSDEPVRAYVSLSSDRLSRSGYRAMADVVSSKDMMARLIEDAKSELKSFAMRFDRIRKVVGFPPLFKDIERITG